MFQVPTKIDICCNSSLGEWRFLSCCTTWQKCSLFRTLPNKKTSFLRPSSFISNRQLFFVHFISCSTKTILKYVDQVAHFYINIMIIINSVSIFSTKILLLSCRKTLLESKVVLLGLTTNNFPCCISTVKFSFWPFFSVTWKEIIPLFGSHILQCLISILEIK